jgi:hypothetical protein
MFRSTWPRHRSPGDPLSLQPFTALARTMLLPACRSHIRRNSRSRRHRTCSVRLPPSPRDLRGRSGKARRNNRLEKHFRKASPISPLLAFHPPPETCVAEAEKSDATADWKSTSVKRHQFLQFLPWLNIGPLPLGGWCDSIGYGVPGTMRNHVVSPPWCPRNPGTPEETAHRVQCRTGNTRFPSPRDPSE